MTFTKYSHKGNNACQAIENASKVSKLLKEIKTEHPLQYMKGILLNMPLVYRLDNRINIKDGYFYFDHDFLNTPEFIQAISLTNRPTIKHLGK